MNELLAKITIKANEIGVPTSTANLGVGMSNIIKLLISAIGMLAIVFIIVGGLQFTYARGNAKEVQRARETVLYAVVGLILAIAAYAIVTFVTNGVSNKGL